MTESSTSLGALSPDDQKEIRSTMAAGLAMKQEIADLQGSLKDQVKAVSEKHSIKPADFMKAINVAFKAKHADEKITFDTVEDILSITGHA